MQKQILLKCKLLGKSHKHITDIDFIRRYDPSDPLTDLDVFSDDDRCDDSSILHLRLRYITV